MFNLPGLQLHRGMDVQSHGASSPVASSVEGLQALLESDAQSEVPSASLAVSEPGVSQHAQVTGQVERTNINFEHAVGSAWDALSGNTIEPIWNTGFWKCIFGNDSLGDVQAQQFKRPMPVEIGEQEVQTEPEKRAKSSLTSAQSGPLFQTCVKSSDDITWQEKREALLQLSLKHWLVLIESWDNNIEFVVCLNGCESSNARLLMLGDVFRGKAPSTLTKRSNSMKILCRMLDDVGLQFPCKESSLYEILCELRRTGAPPSRGKGILEAIAFVRYTMGILECDELLRGRRCWGAVTSDAPLQRTQASPLSVKELERLHHVLEHDGDLWNRMFSGTVLFMVYARARWSDAQHAVKILFRQARREFSVCGGAYGSSQDYEGSSTPTPILTAHSSSCWSYRAELG